MARRFRRDEVLARAREVLTAVPDATMERIAGEAGVSQAALYKHFGSRRSLVAELGLSRPTTADRIVAAAAEILAEGGLAGLSVDEAATRAGVSRATAYRLFPGKGPLFKEVLRVFGALDDITAILRLVPRD